MHQTGGLRNEEANAAAWEAGKGAAVGGAKFKVFIQMGFMVMGGSLEADRRIREYEAKVRMEKRMIRDRAVWNQFEEEYEQSASKQDKSR
ncbi:hypothetical protein ACHAP3_000751 [Botrytis cinerea]